MNGIVKILNTSLFWWLVILMPSISMVVALYFQYALDVGPCALCVHARIYMAGLIIVGLIGALHKSTLLRLFLHFVCAGLCIGLSFKCWELFGVERGFIAGSCTMSAGLPPWFALESWFPMLFQSWGLCGVTPQVILGISMAELLMPTSIASAFLAILVAIIKTFTFNINGKCLYQFVSR